MKNIIRISLCTFLFAIWSIDIKAYNGDKFTANTVEGVEMKFMVLDEDDKTCEVWWESIDVNTSGIVTIPSMANGYQVVAIYSRAFAECRNLTEIIRASTVLAVDE